VHCGISIQPYVGSGRVDSAMPALGPLMLQERRQSGHENMSHSCRLCCERLFVIKNSPGCRRDFRVKMWGTSSPGDKLTGDFGNAMEATQIAGRRLVCLVAGNLFTGQFWTFATQSANC
jgi:hypothetical protein